MFVSVSIRVGRGDHWVVSIQDSWIVIIIQLDRSNNALHKFVHMKGLNPSIHPSVLNEWMNEWGKLQLTLWKINRVRSMEWNGTSVASPKCRFENYDTKKHGNISLCTTVLKRWINADRWCGKMDVTSCGSNQLSNRVKYGRSYDEIPIPVASSWSDLEILREFKSWKNDFLFLS